tara:strand:+ start:2087 stop:2437 length:351 start_codon:yes stop_codon:yes gene_type:complete
MPLPEENKRLAVRWHDATLPPLSKTRALLVFQWGFFLSISKIAGSPFMSQQSYGKAIDVAKINGVPIEDEWKQATASACKHFNNVLGPWSDKAHANDLHLDSGFGRPCWARDTLKF